MKKLFVFILLIQVGVWAAEESPLTFDEAVQRYGDADCLSCYCPDGSRQKELFAAVLSHVRDPQQEIATIQAGLKPIVDSGYHVIVPAVVGALFSGMSLACAGLSIGLGVQTGHPLVALPSLLAALCAVPAGLSWRQAWVNRQRSLELKRALWVRENRS